MREKNCTSEKNWTVWILVAEIIWNLGSKPAPMTTYTAPLLCIVLGYSAIVLFFCSVTPCVHSEVRSAGKYCIFFLFLFTTLCYRFYMVDGKLAGTSSIIKAILDHTCSPGCLCTARLAKISFAPSWAGLRSAWSISSPPPLYITDNLLKYRAIWAGTNYSSLLHIFLPLPSHRVLILPHASTTLSSCLLTF